LRLTALFVVGIRRSSDLLNKIGAFAYDRIAVRFALFGRGLLEAVDSSSQSRLGTGSGVAVDDVTRTGLIEPLARQTVFGFSQFDIASLNGFADFAALRSDRSLYGTIVGTTFLILSQTLFRTL